MRIPCSKSSQCFKIISVKWGKKCLIHSKTYYVPFFVAIYPYECAKPVQNVPTTPSGIDPLNTQNHVALLVSQMTWPSTGRALSTSETQTSRMATPILNGWWGSSAVQTQWNPVIHPLNTKKQLQLLWRREQFY